MKLWLLEPDRNKLQPDTGEETYFPWYTGMLGCIVLAETEQQARQLAVGDADNDSYEQYYLQPDKTSCTEVDQTKSQVVYSAYGTG